MEYITTTSGATLSNLLYNQQAANKDNINVFLVLTKEFCSASNSPQS